MCRGQGREGQKRIIEGGALGRGEPWRIYRARASQRRWCLSRTLKDAGLARKRKQQGGGWRGGQPVQVGGQCAGVPALGAGSCRRVHISTGLGWKRRQSRFQPEHVGQPSGGAGYPDPPVLSLHSLTPQNLPERGDSKTAAMLTGRRGHWSSACVGSLTGPAQHHAPSGLSAALTPALEGSCWGEGTRGWRAWGRRVTGRGGRAAAGAGPSALP